MTNIAHHPFGGMVATWVKQSCITLLFAICASPVLATISIDPLFVDLGTQGRGQGVITASNHGEEDAYIAASLVEVINPKAANEKIIDHKNPREAGLLVSPARMIIKPGQKKRVRIVSLSAPQNDRFFKVKIVPQAGPVDMEEGIGVKVLVGYSAWVFARPDGARAQVEGTRKGNVLTLRNSGTTHTQLIQGRYCAADNTPTDGCTDLPAQRLFVDRLLDINLPGQGGTVRFREKKSGAAFLF